MPLKRKRKTESEVTEQIGADANAETSEQITPPSGANGAHGPSAWNLDAFAPYQADRAPEAPGEALEADRTDVYPAELLNGTGASTPGGAEPTGVFDRNQFAEKTDAFESPLQFDRTLHSEDAAQFEKTAAYDVSSGNGLTPHGSGTPELEPLPSIFASFQEEKSLNSTPLFDDSISAHSIPAFDVPEPMASSFDAPVPVAPAFDAPVFDALEPPAPVFDAAPVFGAVPIAMPSMNTTQRFTSEDLGVMPPREESPASPVPSYTGAKTFSGSPLMEPQADLSGAFAATGRLIVRLGRFSASYEVDRPEVMIGRPDPESEIFPEVAIEWDDAISRRHARILHRDDGDYVEDTGSTNGTKLNGVPLSPHDPQRLHSGDLIHVGSRTEIIYYE